MEYLVRQLFRETPADGAPVEISGWVRTLRDSKAFAFIEINDGSFFKNVQVICEESLPNFKEVVKTTLGSALRVKGVLALTPEMKQPFEIKAQEVEIVGLSDPAYPLQKKRHTVEYLRTQAHLRPRTNLFSAVFRIRSLAAQAIHAFFAQRSFVYVHTPIITTSDCEGAGEMFRATTLDLNNLPRDEQGKVKESEDFFGKPANLTVSGQLNAECFALAFRNVYTFGPTFRAEKSYTPRHAAEFWMFEPEIAFADLNDDMELAEDMLKFVVRDVLEKVVTDYPVFPAKPNMEEVKRAFTVLENHSVIQRLEGKFNQGSCRIAILPTILSAVSSEKLNLVVSVLKKEETDEEAEEDPADQLALFQ